jgi:enterochelin esterase-like enzyme
VIPTILLSLLLGAGFASAEGFEDFISRIQSAPQAERQAIADSLLADLPEGRTPIREEGRAWFLWFTAASSVAVAGDMSGWSPELVLNAVAGTTFRYRRFDCENDARLDYKFVVNGSQWLLDPHNPDTVSGGFGPNSELAMPDYEQPVEILDHGYPPCEVDTWSNFHSPQLNNTRTIRVLRPPGWDGLSPRPVWIIHDGLEYISLGSLAHVIAWMAVHRPELELPICVCVPPVNRTQEYQTTQQAAFGEFIVETVVPFVEQQYSTYGAQPEKWTSMGASNGGNISAYLAGEYPGRFGRLALASPYLPPEQRARIAALPPESLRIHLVWGSYDIATLIPLIDDFLDMLNERGVPHQAREAHEGHSWGFWRAEIDEHLSYLLDPAVGTDPSRGERPATPQLLRPWPNPFNGELRVTLEGLRGPTRLRVYDLLGALRASDHLPAGLRQWTWRPEDLPSGRYLIEATAPGGRATTWVSLIH